VTTVKVEIGFSGAGVAETLVLDSPTRGALDTFRLGPFDTVVDLSNRVRSLNVRRGRADLTEPVLVGNAQVVLGNLDGLLDPQNESSILFPGVQPRRTFNVYADDIQVFAGFVETIALDYTLDGDATVSVSALDGLSRLGIAGFGLTGLTVTAEQSGERIETVINSNPSFWDGGLDLDAGQSQVAAGTATGNALEYLRQVERSEAGFLFAGRDGDLVFQARNAVVGGTAIYTLTDEGTGIAYEAIERVSGADDLFNFIEATVGGTAVSATDTNSVDDFGLRVLDLRTLQLTDQAQERVDYELVRRSEQLPSVRRVRVSQERQQSTAVLGTELGDRVTVRFAPPGVTPSTQDSRVIALTHSFTVGAGWRTDVGVRSLAADPFFVLDDLVLGRLDENALTY
jgi:hypothetical protein